MLFSFQNPIGEKFTLPSGQTANLQCQVWDFEMESGLQNEPSVTWTREGYAFSNGLHAVTGYNYSIENATVRDAGFYFCTATSSQGSVLYWSTRAVQVHGTDLNSGVQGLNPDVPILSDRPKPGTIWYRPKPKLRNRFGQNRN